jgi:Protein of unknown function (DUF1493)
MHLHPRRVWLYEQSPPSWAKTVTIKASRLNLMSNNFLEDKVKAFVATQICIDIGKLCLQTRLREDLALYGDDAEEFFIKFSHEFQVELLEFNFDEYFPPEPTLLDPFIFILRLLRKKRYKSILIKDLIAVAETRRINIIHNS